MPFIESRLRGKQMLASLLSGGGKVLILNHLLTVWWLSRPGEEEEGRERHYTHEHSGKSRGSTYKWLKCWGGTCIEAYFVVVWGNTWLLLTCSYLAWCKLLRIARRSYLNAVLTPVFLSVLLCIVLRRVQWSCLLVVVQVRGGCCCWSVCV